MSWGVQGKRTIQRQCCFPQTSTSVDTRSRKMSSQAVPEITERQYVNIHFKIPLRTICERHRTVYPLDMKSQNDISMFTGSPSTSTYEPLYSPQREDTGHMQLLLDQMKTHSGSKKPPFLKKGNHWKICLPSATQICHVIYLFHFFWIWKLFLENRA